MWIEEDYEELHPKARKALQRAKAVNRKKTVPVRVNSHTVIWITPEQSADPKFMERFNKRWETR